MKGTDLFAFPARAAGALACITIGRANLDLYPPPGQHLARARSYQAFAGGSPANIAAGLVRRGLRAGIITKVAADGIGDFVIQYLQDFGIDVSHVRRQSSAARTSLAFAERRRDAQTVFYRNQPADLLLEPSDICADYIASAQVLFLSGSALCSEPCRSAAQRAVATAQEAGTLVAMDIDYRPYGWDSAGQAAEVLQQAARHCDLLIGTAEEFRLACNEAGGVLDNRIGELDRGAEEQKFLSLFSHARLLVVKRGAEGANAWSRGELLCAGALLPAALQKPWGAGDAFASSLLASLLQGKAVAAAMLDAAASASLNISGASCTEAMPTGEEIANFLARYHSGNLGPEWRD